MYKLVRISLSQTHIGGGFEDVEEIIAVSKERYKLEEWFNFNYSGYALDNLDGSFGSLYRIKDFDAEIVD